MKILIVILYCSLATSALAQTQIYVSPNGSDENSGLENDLPLRSIQKAQELVRELKNNRGDVVVHLLTGVHYLENTLKFNAEDGGNRNGKVIYKGSALGEVTISGGTVLPTADAYMENGLIVIETDVAPFRQLYVNDKKAIRSRFPNTGYLKSVSILICILKSETVIG